MFVTVLRLRPCLAPNQQHRSTRKIILSATDILLFKTIKSEVLYINNAKIMQFVFNSTTPFIHNVPTATQSTVNCTLKKKKHQ